MFFLVIIIAVFFRFYSLSSVPPSPSLDEVSIGYNAYSILKTGMDEYGNKYPTLLRAYDDWRPALYVYSVIPFIEIFGLNVYSVRLPSILLSILTVIATYFLVREILKYCLKKTNPDIQITSFVPLTASFLLAVSPWHVYFSRLGHEMNGALSFFVFGLLFFTKYINLLGKENSKNNFYLLVSSVFFGISFNFYQSTKLFIPVILAAMFVFFYKELFARKRILALSLIVGLLVILPVLFASFSSNALIRFHGTNIYNSSADIFETNSKRILWDRQNMDLLGLFFDNRRMSFLLIPLNAYLSHFNLAWLFANSGKEFFKIPDFGLLLVLELPLFALGLIFLLKSKNNYSKFTFFILSWILIAPLPAAITTGSPHAARMYNVLPAFQIIEAFGLYFLINRIIIIKNLSLKFFSLSGVFGIIIMSVLWFFHSYFVNFRKELSYQFQYGSIQALSYAISNQNKYANILVSNRKNLLESYMFYLYTTKYDPISYLKSGGTKSGGFDESHKIDKFEFDNPRLNSGKNGKTLYVINPYELQTNEINIIAVIKFMDGKDAVWLAESK